ncbi:MAG: 4Fe-4S binding protein [Rhodospirillaceae bacterium]|jgi:Fe-S-cluster-containing dehydrogenase component|nr:4Fe-4S binding protein [Rhodospirillaceae bacterium]MBT4938248.1 4Fe-4S binding protein [Rhodospirillaceae bacterium]MBT5941274.1 4Fe-4S binding protein [Rhodospirillaceae bacterium]MBT7267613.1 4Fe-4S binding protein [Rhodospirillaceae bacterium]
MAKYGILIDYDFCTGCHTCEVACQQEHNYPVGLNGIKVTEYEYQLANGKVKIDYMPFLTDLCDLCMSRQAEGERPSCVKHCQTACMKFGLTTDLTAEAATRPRAALHTHVPK